MGATGALSCSEIGRLHCVQQFVDRSQHGATQLCGEPPSGDGVGSGILRWAATTDALVAAAAVALRPRWPTSYCWRFRHAAASRQ